MNPAIVLSTHTMGLGVIRALGMMGVPIIGVYHDKSDMGYVSRYVKERIFAPHPEESEEGFLDLLIDTAGRFAGSLLIPASDETLVTVSRHKSLLEQYFTVGCTEWEVTERFLDKKHTYALADAIGVPVPKTVVPQCAEDVRRYSETISYPCMVKPSQSHRYFELFRRKMVKVDTFDQLLAAYQQAADAGLEVLLQEFIPGDDSMGANYNSYFWRGEPMVEFTAQQLRNGPPESGSPRVVMSKHIPEMIEAGRSILEAMDFYGYSCTEFKLDARDGVYKLMEINGRHNRSGLLAVRCGVNFPWLQYKHLITGELPSAHTYPTGVYWVDIARDVTYSVRYAARERYSPLQYARPYIGPHVFSTFAWKDPKPFMKRIAGLVMRAIRTAHSSITVRSRQ